MKYVYIVKSNYYGPNAQGNILGVFRSKTRAMAHFKVILDDRTERCGHEYGVQHKNKIAWVQEYKLADLPESMREPQFCFAAFYVAGDPESEKVELLRCLVSPVRKK